MKLNQIIKVGDAIEIISQQTDASIPEIINALSGVAFHEEDAGELMHYHQDESDV